MALGPIVKSVLKSGIEELPEDFAVKAESVPNVLKKVGVKDEELKFADLDLPKTGKVTKSDLAQAEAKRADAFTEEVQADPRFKWVSLAPGRANPTYKETVYKFSDGNSPLSVEQFNRDMIEVETAFEEGYDVPDDVMQRLSAIADEVGVSNIPALFEVPMHQVEDALSRYTSEHFPDTPNYLMHTRTYDEMLSGRKTRVLQEVQSDLHQQGRARGYDLGKQEFSSEQIKRIDDLIDEAITVDEAIRSTGGVAQDAGYARLEEITKELEEFFPNMPEDFQYADAGYTAYDMIIQFAAENVPTSPYEKTWLRKGIEREVAKGLEEGRDQIAVPIKGEGVEALHRAPGVQRWYETQVASTMKKMAKQQGMEFEVIVEDGMEYAVLRPKVGTMPKSFSLYASPAAVGYLAYESLKAGYSEEDIRTQMQKQGLDDEDMTAAFADAKKIEAAKAQGYSDDEIKQFLGGREQVQTGAADTTPPIEIDPEIMVKSDAAKQLLADEELSAQELVAKLQVVQPNMASVTRRIAAFGGHNESEAIATQMERNSVQNIVNLAKKRGINLEWEDGEFYAVTEQGRTRVTPSVWQQLWEEKGEIAGAITGGIAGARAGAQMAPAVKHPLARLSMIGGASIAGAAIGSVAGTEGDYIWNSIQLQEDMSAEIAAHKALTATEASVIGDIVGLGVIGSIKGGWRALKRAKDMVLDGNSQGAYQALKDTMFINDEQAEEIVAALGKKTDVAGRSPAEQAIAATVATQPGGESIIKAAGTVDPQAGAAVIQSIDTRAKDLLATTAKLSDENVGRVLKGELQGYTTAVKDFYQTVKDQAINSPRANNFSFDYDKLALKPVLDTLHKNITDPTLRQKFLYQMERIQAMSESRTFGDLLELRQLVNEFKYNKRITKQADWNAVNRVLTEIDGAIRKGSDLVLEDPAKWRADYAAARKQYSEMKALEKNVLARVVGRKGVSEDAVVKALTKYIGAIDDTFHEVVVKLPKATRAKVEGAVINNLANKYTFGMEGGQRATHFPLLAKDLESVTFTSPDNRRAKKAILELAEVFKNDVPLSQATGNIQIPQFQSYLTTDPVVRAKFELASGVFNYIKTLAPGQAQRNLALVRKAAKVLEQPMNSKAMRELMEEAGDSVDIQPQLLQLAEEAAKRKANTGDVGAVRVKLYGKGKILGAKGAGEEYTIPLHRIATIEQVQQISEAYGINRENKKLLDETLRKQGFKAVQIGADKVRRID